MKIIMLLLKANFESWYEKTLILSLLKSYFTVQNPPYYIEIQIYIIYNKI